MYNLDNVYGKVDKIRNLKLVENNEKFSIMDKNQVYHLANTIVDKIEKSKYRTIVFSESGASPLVTECDKIAKKRNLQLEWFGFKTPRDININLYEMIKFYLSEKELAEKIKIGEITTRKNALKEYCEKIDLEKYLPREEIKIDEVIKNTENNPLELNSLDEILEGTKLYEIFSKEFLFFDEYILSGKILRNFNFYSKLICKKAKFKIGAYAIFSENVDKLKQIEFSIYSKNNILEAYKNGAYPYEDRIDIIGYFYYITNTQYLKIYIKNLKKECENKQLELNEFISNIYKFIEERDLYNLLKSKCKKEDLKEYFTKEDIVRYIFKIFEQDFSGNSEKATFLNEAFELYAPIWIPMPKEYHYQYWKSLVKIQEDIDYFVNSNKVIYSNIREYFISELSEKILNM